MSLLLRPLWCVPQRIGWFEFRFIRGWRFLDREIIRLRRLRRVMLLSLICSSFLQILRRTVTKMFVLWPRQLLQTPVHLYRSLWLYSSLVHSTEKKYSDAPPSSFDGCASWTRYNLDYIVLTKTECASRQYAWKVTEASWRAGRFRLALPVPCFTSYLFCSF